jgi:hypothetical protein
MFVAPDSVAQIGGIPAQGGRSPVAEMFARQVLQTPLQAALPQLYSCKQDERSHSTRQDQG